MWEWVDVVTCYTDRNVKDMQETKEKIKSSKGILRYWDDLGPGLTTGAADDDPSGIATYSQTGSQYGYYFLWLAVFTFPLMGIVQEMCARLGLVSGRGLAANIRLHFPKWILYSTAFLLFAANTFNLGADLGAMAEATRLIAPNIPFALLVVVFAIVILLLQIFISYAKYARVLKYLTLVLLAYILTAGFVNINWSQVVLHSLVPQIRFDFDQIYIVTAILGTTISPYLFFWQTSQEIEEEILEGKKTLKARQVTSVADISRMRKDVWTGMFVSNVVMFFIIAVCAASLFENGITNISSAKDAAEALRPLAGNAAYLLFTIGIIGTGALAVPILAGSASYAISESMGWKEGLYRNFKEAQAFYGVIAVAMVLGLLMNFIGINPIKALIYSAVANGLLAPLALVMIVILSGKKQVMGEFKNNKIQAGLGWLVTGVMFLASGATIVSFFF